MAILPSKPCSYPRCTHFATHAGRCDLHQHQKADKQKYDRNREETQEWRKWIHSNRYRNMARSFKKAHPLCEACLEEGKVTPTYLIHHIVPHEGNAELFWDMENNWKALCNYHHELIHGAERFGNKKERCERIY